MFSRSKSATGGAPTSPDPVEQAAEVERAGKGRPTPKRRDAEAANKRPLVAGDRRVAAQNAKAAQREARERQYRAMQTGDERYLPPKDKGPMRRYIRDYIDARWNLGEFFLPIALVFIVATLFANRSPVLSLIVVVGLYGFVLAAVLDGVILWQRLKRRLREKFGADVQFPRGTAMYAVTRAFQLRRARLPKPLQAKRGVRPE